MNFYKSKIKKNFIFILLILWITTCKNDVVDIMPYVHFTQTVSYGEIVTLGVPGAMYKTGGYAGLIIYQIQPGGFLVFDRLCTNYPNDTAAVELDKSGQIATCPKCKSSFLLPANGSKSNDGPAQLPLKQYLFSYDGTRITIVN